MTLLASLSPAARAQLLAQLPRGWTPGMSLPPEAVALLRRLADVTGAGVKARATSSREGGI